MHQPLVETGWHIGKHGVCDGFGHGATVCTRQGARAGEHAAHQLYRGREQTAVQGGMDSVLITLPRQLRIERDRMQARVTWPLSRGRGYIVLSPGKRLALDIMYGNSFMYGYRYRQYTDSAINILFTGLDLRIMPIGCLSTSTVHRDTGVATRAKCVQIATDATGGGPGRP